MDLTQVNKIMARECGVELVSNFVSLLYLPKDKPKRAEIWTIEDARCREIIREKYGISTISLGGCNLWYWAIPRTGKICDGENYDSIAEAEKACITAICKQMESDNE